MLPTPRNSRPDNSLQATLRHRRPSPVYCGFAGKSLGFLIRPHLHVSLPAMWQMFRRKMVVRKLLSISTVCLLRTAKRPGSVVGIPSASMAEGSALGNQVGQASSLSGFVLAKSKPDRLEACPTYASRFAAIWDKKLLPCGIAPPKFSAMVWPMSASVSRMPRLTPRFPAVL
jgi:hypothetical protein